MRPLRWKSSPPAALAPWIDCFWGWESAASSLPLLSAGTGADLFFHYGAPPHIDGVPASEAHLLAYRRRSAELVPAGEIGFVAVRFRAGRLIQFCRFDWDQLTDRVSPVEALWGREGRDLCLRLAKTTSRDARTALLGEFLSEQLGLAQRRREISLNRLIDRLYYAPQTRVTRLTEEFGWSVRQLERVFAGAFGTTPKRFARVARLHRTLRTLALEPEAKPLGSALAAGYFDQAHFYHDVRELTGIAPVSLFKRLRGGAHFYLPPSSRADVARDAI
ncbi:MAG: helix-turn-helix domain-containing protein [Gaiellaceae bacterium]